MASRRLGKNLGNLIEEGKRKMGLKLLEEFKDYAYFITPLGVEITGAAVTCTIYNPSETTTVGVVTEVGSGLYRCPFTPNVAGTWKTRWRCTSGVNVYGQVHEFKVGGGQEEDILSFIDTEVAAILAAVDTEVAAIKAKTDLLVTTEVGLYYSGTVTAIDTNKFTIPTLTGLGAGKFKDVQNPYQSFVLRDAGGLGAVPQGETRAITNYDPATGEFTIIAFSTPVGLGDEVLILHPQVALGAGILASGVFTTSSATAPADTGRLEATNYWRGCLLMPIAGVCAFQPRIIRAFTVTTGVFTMDDNTPFTAAPGLVNYVILASQEPLVAGADSSLNLMPSHVLGNKGDAAVTTVGTVASIIAYIKGLLNQLANGTYGLNALLTSIGLRSTPAQVLTQVQTETGVFSGQTNLKTLLAALGIPDTAAKPLYTCLITDRLDHATYGLSAIRALIAALNNLSSATVEGLVENAVDSGNLTHDITTANDKTETQIFALASTGIYALSIVFDLDALETAVEGGTVSIRLYNKVDGSNYSDKPSACATYVVGTSIEYPSFELGLVHGNVKVTIQCSTDVTVTRTIAYRYQTRDLGA
jgi:hypothetical protein